MTEFYFRDAHGRVHKRLSSQCPPGMTPHSGRLQDGESMSVSMSMMDSLQRSVADESLRVSDTAGASHLLRDAGQCITDALAACPRDTRDLQAKVARGIMDAEGAASAGSFQNAISSLVSMGRQYHARSFLARDKGQKDALDRASSAIAGYADALLATRRSEGLVA